MKDMDMYEEEEEDDDPPMPPSNQCALPAHASSQSKKKKGPVLTEDEPSSPGHDRFLAPPISSVLLIVCVAENPDIDMASKQLKATQITDTQFAPTQPPPPTKRIHPDDRMYPRSLVHYP